MRALILWVTGLRLVRRLVTGWSVGRWVAMRFVAGESVEDGIRAARSLAREGVPAMLDLLGENVSSEAQAAAAAENYVRALKRAHEAPELGANISVKLTQLGLDQSRELCVENLRRVLDAADGTLVMIDMEGSDYTEATLSVYREMRADHSNVGVCIQAMLRRTATDALALATPEHTLRLCKGAYLEPEDVALPDKPAVDDAYARIGATLLAGGATVHLATHDERLVRGAQRFIASRAIPRDRLEFHMLYGIRRDLQRRLVREGYKVRVYVPYGDEWYPYLTRRLAERPANLWFFASQLVRVGRRRG